MSHAGPCHGREPDRYKHRFCEHGKTWAPLLEEFEEWKAEQDAKRARRRRHGKSEARGPERKP